MNSLSPLPEYPIWLISSPDLIAIQKLRSLPIEPEKQLVKICISLGMHLIHLKHAKVKIHGLTYEGCMVQADGYEIVPFVPGLELSPTIMDKTISLHPQQYWYPPGSDDIEH